MGDVEAAASSSSSSSDPNNMIQQEQKPLTQDKKQKQKGGLRTMPFIIANEAFERVASFGLTPNMIFYLMKEYHIKVAAASSFLSFVGFGSNFLPIAGAFVSDSYLGRFRTIAIGTLFSFLGMGLLWLTAMIPAARPPKCEQYSPNCKPASSAQLTLLIAAFVVMGIGGAGIKPCSLAFGADQVDREGNPKKKRALQTFFNWYYTSSTVSVLLALTVIVYIQDHFGWKIGFGIPAICMFLSGFFFFLASSIYIKAKPNKSLFAGFAQVPIATFRNRHILLPKNIEEGSYLHINGSNMVVPSDKLRFLNKACIIIDHEKDLNSDGLASNPWSLCTVQQVEELKAVLKVIPIWSTGIIMSLSMNAQSFPLLQANSMDRHLTSKFQIPPASFGMFTIATIVIWLPLYDRLIVPMLAKITGKPYGISLKQRMGVGIVITFLGSVLSAVVEGIRRKNAIKQGFADNPHGVIDMSAMWLVPQYCLGGIAEAFYAVGQNEFYYSQFPNTMSSIATSLFGIGMAFGNLLAGVMVQIVDDITKRGGKESWVSDNLNKGHFDYYYWTLTVIAGFNIFYYLLCSWAYGPTEGERIRIPDDDDDVKDDELPKSKELQMGMVLLWVTSMFPSVKPPHCSITSQSCESATPAHLLLLYASFALMSIGAGGIRPCSMVFGAGQLDKEGNPKNKRVLQSFFNWYYASMTVSIMIAITVIVYIQDQFGWKIGFGVPVIIMFVSVLCFVMASSLYIKEKPKKSLFSGFVQVSVAAFRKRHIALPPKAKDGSYYHSKDSKMVVPSERLRFLNRACIIRGPKQDSTPGSLCTVEQVEEL